VVTRAQINSFVYPVITTLLLLAAWTCAVRVFHVPSYVLPPPEAVARALKQGYIDGSYWPHFFFTLQSTCIGFVCGSVTAFLLGCLFAESRTIEQFCYPLVVAFQSLPKVALAPLILVWFGFDLTSKVVMVALVCFFPMFINTVVGLKNTPPALLDLMHAFSASRFYILVHIKIPSAAGHLFAGLEIAAVMGLIGAVVAEFVSSTRGLGYLISASAGNMETNVMFAGLASLAVLGVAASLLIQLLHRKVVFWERPRGERSFSE
jgi:NitT/TauT family transport system permease protein